MRTSRKLTHVLFAVFTLALMSVAALAQPGNVGPVPGSAIPASSEASDMKQGALLVYNYYNSDASNVSAIDTKINITNTNVTSSTVVHFFFVSSTNNCSVADFKTELTQSQTYSFLVSDFDPGNRGFIVAVAESEGGLPINFNYLIGDLFLKDLSKQANLSAVSFAAQWTNANNGGTITAEGFWPVVGGSESASTVDVTFGTTGSYNALGNALAVSNIPSLAAGDRTYLVINRPSGSYVTATDSVGTLFGLLYDDAEQSQSFQLPSGGCQTQGVLGDSFPRTAPRFTTVIPAGRTGWMKVYNTGGNTGIVGAVVTYNTTDNVNFWGGHNLHVITKTTGTNTATFPVFPFELQTN
jgi:hypothetical protein